MFSVWKPNIWVVPSKIARRMQCDIECAKFADIPIVAKEQTLVTPCVYYTRDFGIASNLVVEDVDLEFETGLKAVIYFYIMCNARIEFDSRCEIINVLLGTRLNK